MHFGSYRCWLSVEIIDYLIVNFRTVNCSKKFSLHQLSCLRLCYWRFAVTICRRREGRMTLSTRYIDSEVAVGDEPDDGIQSRLP